MYKRIVIGIDQSYTKTGISICADGVLLKVGSLDFKGYKTKSEKRKHVAIVLAKLLKKASQEASHTHIICERIRMFNKGNGAEASALSISYIKATGALIGVIVDTAAEYGVVVSSVDTRSWKAQVVGSCKPGLGGNKKLPTIEHVCKLGFEGSISSKNRAGKVVFDDDAADSACIALYGFIPKGRQNLKVEE